VYRLSLEDFAHRGLRRVVESGLQGRERGEMKCESRCSTLALASFLKEASVDVEVLVFGLDTLVQPGPSGDLRRSAEESYRRHAEEYTQECSCCSVLAGKERLLNVVVTPGIGVFHGYAYRGSPVHIFNVAFSRILEGIERLEPSFIVVDITHGVNYQMTAILYAVMAAAALEGMEGRVSIFNSEPYPRRPRERSSQPSSGAAQQEQPPQEPPGLSLLDVTQLSGALSFAQAVGDALQLRSARLSRLLEEGGAGRGGLQEALRRLVNFVRLLENVAVGITFPGAVSEQGEGLPYSICSALEGLPRREGERGQGIEYPPRVEGSTVSYPAAHIEESLRLALERILERLARGGRLGGQTLPGLCAGDAGRSLVEYMARAARWLGFAGLRYAQLIVKSEQQKLAMFVSRATRCLGALGSDELLSQYLRIGDGQVEVGAPLLAALAEQEAEKEASCEEVVAAARGKLESRAPQGRGARQVGEKEARNISAHAGVSYTIIRSVTLARLEGERWAITRVVFDKSMVEQYLRILGAG
jgi:CRISPR-associated protein Csx1